MKFAFLRALTGTDRTLGVAWYYSQKNDGRTDGRHLEWREESAWRQLDPQLHEGLSTLPERSVAALEAAAIWPKGTAFHREPIPYKKHRSSWAEKKRTALNEANIIFFDPDNGLGKADAKHATLEEVLNSRRTGKAVVFITFPAYVPHDEQVQKLHEKLIREAGASSLVTLRTSVSVPTKTPNKFVPRARWFTVVDPDSALIDRTNAFSESLKIVPRVSANVVPT